VGFAPKRILIGASQTVWKETDIAVERLTKEQRDRNSTGAGWHAASLLKRLLSGRELHFCPEATMGYRSKIVKITREVGPIGIWGFFDQAINDIFVQHPNNSAYYKERDDEQLDEDKKEK
jgi:hypothetical protein